VNPVTSCSSCPLLSFTAGILPSPVCGPKGAPAMNGGCAALIHPTSNTEKKDKMDKIFQDEQEVFIL
jgi:hypothetical protein